MAEITIRKGMPDAQLTREQFAERLRRRFHDPAFAAAEAEIETIVAIAWEAYDDYRKAPYTHPAGPGFADPAYDLSDEWRETARQIAAAQARQKDAAAPSRILIVNGSSRSEHTCPGEMSKTFRLATLAREAIESEGGIEVDFLDLSR